MSMTREEAIKTFEEILQLSPTLDETGCSVTEAMKVALSALRTVSREQVERMAGEWVLDINKGPAVFYWSSCSESFEIHSYEFQTDRFCPVCMAPMTDEAGDILLKRLEALKDGL